MSFILKPSNHAITLSELNTLGQDFSRLVKTSSSTFNNYQFEKVDKADVISVLTNLVPNTSSFIKGMRIVPTLRSNNSIRFLYCLTISEFHDKFSGFTVFQYDTPTNPFDMLDNSKVYWVENEKFVKISGANIQIAKDDFQRYVDEILISHDGTGNSTSFENFIEDEDVTSSYVTLNSLQDLLSDNRDSSNNEPEFLYFLNIAKEYDGIFRHSSAESIFIPGTNSGNNPGSGPFSNKAADMHGICPPMCGKSVAHKSKLITP
jgi:hypothetical protein